MATGLAFSSCEFLQVDMQSQMLVTLPSGSEKSFTITPTGQVMGSVIYTDDAGRMSPFLTQKNNLMIPACHAGSLQKVSFGPVYGTAGGLLPNFSVAKSPVCTLPMATQKPLTTTISQAKSQTYSVLLPSKSYDELLHCSSTKPDYRQQQQQQHQQQQQQQPLLSDHKSGGESKSPERYQTPLTAEANNSGGLNPVSLTYNSTVSFTPTQMTPLSSRSPSHTTDPCACGQASFV